MKTYIVIHNLNSRGKNLSQEYIEDLFKSKIIPFIYFSTSSIDELNNVIVEYSDTNKYQYCTIGGDGSLNSLINALMNNGIKNPEVACLPAGSGSDFIRTFALPQNIEETINHLTTDFYYDVDVGRVETENKTKYFLNVLNIGFLASSVEVSEKMPKLIRRFRYPISFWIKIFFAKAKKLVSNRSIDSSIL